MAKRHTARPVGPGKKRSTFHLTQDQISALAQVSALTQIPTARLVRNGVDRELTAHGIKMQNGARVKGSDR
jgi:hypothetical protein